MKNQLQKKSLKEQVREKLLYKIVRGELVSGDRLKIIPISKELNVSQAPVREAIQCIATAGYLEVVPNSGVRVRKYSSKEVEEMYEIRKILEFQYFNVSNLDSVAMSERLNLILRNMVDSINNDDFRSFEKFDNKFHRTFVESTGNSKMLEIWDSLLIPLNIASNAKNKKVSRNLVLLYHTPIIASLQKGNLKDAKKYLIEHYNNQ